METQEILVENIKCSGCMNSIKTAVLKLPGVAEVKIIKEEDKVQIIGEGMDRIALVAKLNSLGYPEKGNNTLLKQAKSMVSCALGRMSE
ncbi:MAG: heavy-metal-associated domain-containing protein [Sphingobacteriaceae bacterium]